LGVTGTAPSGGAFKAPSSGRGFLHNKVWFPVRVFNDKYTERTIGSVVDIDLRESGLVIGEPNKELEDAQNKHLGLSKKKVNYEKQSLETIQKAIEEYSEIANSKADVSDKISIDRLFEDSCEFSLNPSSISKRQKLGYVTPDDSLQKIESRNFNEILRPDELTGIFKEIVHRPELEQEQESLLLNFTNFFEAGVQAYSSSKPNQCPFCFQDWLDAKTAIKKYTDFLQSTYNQKRDVVKSAKHRINELKKEIQRINDIVKSTKLVVAEEGKKYDVDTKAYKEIVFDATFEKEFDSLVSKKLSAMESQINIDEQLSMFVQGLEISVNSINETVQKIKDAISLISSKRRAANVEIAKHIMRRIWEENKDKREEFINTCKELERLETKIEELENREDNQGTIQTVFNSLIDFLGLSEYRINNDKKLVLRLEQDYDISDEGARVSSAQKKILSLCYFFAEIISEIDKPKDLKNYIIIFDDPVDSADYIYFHSIAALIENIEPILNKILKKNDMKFGQVIVMTHNSLLFDRLAINFETKRTLKKVNNVTEIKRSDKTINNYKLYLEYIVGYYANPKKNRKEMIFIGNLIRRVLEILANFNNLSSNEFNQFVIDLGKPKLALLSNHLSHESFTKVLNPLNSEAELQMACEELLEVIESCHPEQFKYIEREMLGVE